jgi:hypothetical protein
MLSSSTAWARLHVYGADLLYKYNDTYRYSFDHQHGNDELYFNANFASDATLDYSVWANRRLTRHLQLQYNLSSFGANKELALVFGFDAISESRLLIHTSAGLLEDVTLVPGDNQFLMEVESLDTLSLYFIHSRLDGSSYGGSWFFKGITGYVI